MLEDGREVELKVGLMGEEVSSFAKDLIMDALQFDPAHRPTMASLLKQLRAYLEDQDYDYVPSKHPITVSAEDPVQLAAAIKLLALMEEDKDLFSS